MKTRERLRSLWAIMYYLGFIPMVRNPLFMAFVFSQPFTLLFILFVASGGTALPYGLAGALTMVTTELGLFVGTDLASYKLQNRFQDIVVASPVTPLTYMFGVALSDLIFGSPRPRHPLRIDRREGGLGRGTGIVRWSGHSPMGHSDEHRLLLLSLRARTPRTHSSSTASSPPSFRSSLPSITR